MAIATPGTAGNYILVPHYAGINPARPFSGSIRVKRDAANEEDFLFLKRGAGNTGWGFRITSTNLFGFTWYGVADYVSSVDIGTSTDWMQLGFSITAGGTLRFYKDGVQLGSPVTIGSPSTNTGGLLIGAGQSNAGVPVAYSDAAFANAAIAQAEWSAVDHAILAEGGPITALSAKPVMYLPLVRDYVNVVGPAASAVGSLTVVEHPRTILPRRRTIISVPAAGGGTSEERDLSSAGVATASFSSKSLWEASLTSSGSATVSFEPKAQIKSTFTSSATAAVNFLGSQHGNAELTASGAAAVSFTGRTKHTGTLTLAALASASFEAKSLRKAVLSAAGDSQVQFRNATEGSAPPTGGFTPIRRRRRH